jgi:hypothetical protein
MTERDITLSELNFKETMALDLFKKGRYSNNLFYYIFESDSEFFEYVFSGVDHSYKEICKIISGLNSDESNNEINKSEKRNIKLKYYLPSLKEVEFIIKEYLEHVDYYGKGNVHRSFFMDNYVWTSSTNEFDEHYIVKLKWLCAEKTGRNYFRPDDYNASMFFAGGNWYKFDVIVLHNTDNKRYEAMNENYTIVKGKLVAEEF